MRAAKFTRLCCWMVVMIAAPAWSQLPKPRLTRGANTVSTESQRALHALRNARPTPMPDHRVAPMAPLAASDLQQFNPATGSSVTIPAAKHLSIERRREGQRNLIPASSVADRNVNIPFGPEGASPADIRAATVSTEATAPSPFYYPYTFPNNAVFKVVGRWVVNGNSYYWACSAFTASSFHLMTAGHCLYNHDPIGNGSGQGAGWPVELWAWPAQTDVVDPLDHSDWQDWPYGVTKGTLFTAYNAWILSSDLNWDVGWVTLDRRIGDHVGWMGREWSVDTSGLNFNGYPAQAPYVPADNPYQYPGFDANNVTGYTCCRINMAAYIYGGHSGGPVWRFDGVNRWVQGLNSTSNRVGNATATRITSQVEADLENTIFIDTNSHPPSDLAEPIEYVFNGSSKGIGQTTAAIGSSFGMTLNTFNAGYVDAGNITADVYLTTDPNDVTSGYYIGTHDFGYVGAFRYVVQSSRMTVPLQVPPRAYYVGYVLGAASRYLTDKNTVVITDATLNAYCNSDTSEPDDNARQAKLITPGSQSHTICGQADQDWVYFTLGGTSSVSVATSGSAGDTALTLYNSQLQEIDFNDDNRRSYFAAINRTCGVNALPEGTYYAKVSSFEGKSVVPSYSLNLAVTPCPGVLSVRVQPGVVGGNSITGIVTLTSPAPATGVTVSLSSDNSVATVASSVSVPRGASRSTFTITTSPVSTVTTVTITATCEGTTSADTVTVLRPSPLRVILSPDAVTGGDVSVATIQLNGAAPSGGITVSASSSNSAAFMRDTITIPEGNSSAQFRILTRPVLATRRPVITATAGETTVRAVLTVHP